MGLDAEAEPHTSRGRADVRVKTKTQVWIIELKVIQNKSEAKDAAEKALTQIIEQGYAERYSEAILLGLAIDDESRNIAEYRTKMFSSVHPDELEPGSGKSNVPHRVS